MEDVWRAMSGISGKDHAKRLGLIHHPFLGKSGKNTQENINSTCLSSSLVSVGEALHVLLQAALVAEELDVGTVHLDLALLAQADVLLTAERSEAPVLRDDDLLATGELVHGAAESLDGGGAVDVTRPDGEEDLADVDTGNETVGLTESTTHTGLQSIGTGARQHFVDTDDVVGVGADAEVETFLTGDLDEVPAVVSGQNSAPSFFFMRCPFAIAIVCVRGVVLLVGANTGGFESLGAHLFVLIGDHVHAERKVIDGGLLAAKIEDSDLWVGHTTVEPGLRVGLLRESMSAMSITSRHSASKSFNKSNISHR